MSAGDALPQPLAFLLDVDNTLLDNDRVKSQLEARIEHLVGRELAAAFWRLYEEVRVDAGYVDFTQALSRFTASFPREPEFPQLASLVLNYPYEAAIYPGALSAICKLQAWGTVAILSDGDPVFQAAKIAHAGLTRVIDGPVLVYRHKTENLDDVLERVPARHYVLVDDKAEILASCEALMGDRITTVHVNQGRYGTRHQGADAADVEVATIVDVGAVDCSQVIPGGATMTSSGPSAP